MHRVHLDHLLQRYPILKPCAPDVLAAFQLLQTSFLAGGKLLVCGNGGSAADADHLSAELLKAFCLPRPVTPSNGLDPDLAAKLQGGLPAIPLHQFAALTTAYTNDCEAEYAYAQLTLALGAPKDVFLGISTSGKARNVGLAAQVAKSKGMAIIGLSGETGGKLKPLCDVCICAPERETYKVQELHLPIYHTLCLMLEAAFFQTPKSF